MMKPVALVTLLVASVFGQAPYNKPPYGAQYNAAPYKPGYQQDYKAPAYNQYNTYGSNYNAPSSSILLQNSNVLFATGETSAINVAVPDGTEYYVNTQYELIRVDPDGLFRHEQIRVATNVKYAFHGYDDCLWYIDYKPYADIWRMCWKDAPELIPNQPNPVNFVKVANRNWDNGFAVADDGSLWLYAGHQWIRDKDVNNAIDAGFGNDGTQMYLGKDYKLYRWNYETRYWEVFQTGVWVFDIFNIDTMVICDQQYYCKKIVYGKFVGIPEYCTSVNILKDSFYCVTPQSQVKLVAY
ncbi:uncharacterized protein LOC129584163 [Paramacrobiotus metropolitanus]|uniref:uncharacterized protein LOC129584163 n=1 Tax=Paramacrobiotus metropolitanus TaxID=2943436 RepID=UPI0024458DE3|nr:uncharacterized protein LOC129584163 [Paramacrobiotus metropolitanus]